MNINGYVQFLSLLCTLHMNINGYVSFLINMLNTMGGVKYANLVVTMSSGYLLHAAGKYCILLML